MKRILVALLLAVVAVTAFAQNRNRGGTIMASAVRAATVTGQDINNDQYSGVTVILDITAVPTTDTVTLAIQAKDPTSGKYYTLLTGSAEVATATKTYKVYPGITAAANAAVSDMLPAIWRVTITHSAATNFTYSVGYNYNY